MILKLKTKTFIKKFLAIKNLKLYLNDLNCAKQLENQKTYKSTEIKVLKYLSYVYE